MNLIDQKETILSSDKTDSNVNGYHGNTAEIDSSSRHQGDQIISDLEVLTATAIYLLALWAFRNRMKCVVAGIPG